MFAGHSPGPASVIGTAAVLVVLHQVEWKKRGKYETETRVVAQDKDNRSAAKSWPFIPR